MKPGETVVVTVRSVRTEGVHTTLPMGGCGTISTRCYGSGAERAAALEKLKPGDKVEAVVKSWNPDTRMASLVLPGFEDQPPLKSRTQQQATTHVKGGPRQSVAKEAFKPDPPGTTCVFDLANVIGLLPLPCVPNVKVAIKARFPSAGYSTLFYLDRRTGRWPGYALPDDAAEEKFFGDFRTSGNTVE